MQLIAEFTSILLAITASALYVRSAVIAHRDFADASVIFFDDVNEAGASYSPDGCNTLPGDWLDRAESVQISPGFNCSFYELQGCKGTAIALSGTVDELPSPTLYNNIESFSCTKLKDS